MTRAAATVASSRAAPFPSSSSSTRTTTRRATPPRRARAAARQHRAVVSASTSASSSSVEATRALRDALANLSRVAPPASGAAVLEAAKALESPPEEDTLGGIDGLWVTEWTSMDPPYHELQMDDDDDDDDDDGDGDVYVPRAFPLPLAALSFGAFGALNVIATRTVNIVRGAEYVLAIVFVDAGDGAGDDDDEFAEGVLFLRGSCAPASDSDSDLDSDSGAEASRRLRVAFEEAKVCATGFCRETLTGAGMLEGGEGDGDGGDECYDDATKFFTKSARLAAPATHIDVAYVDGTTRVHAGASGMTYVLSREEASIEAVKDEKWSFERYSDGKWEEELRKFFFLEGCDC